MSKANASFGRSHCRCPKATPRSASPCAGRSACSWLVRRRRTDTSNSVTRTRLRWPRFVVGSTAYRWRSSWPLPGLPCWASKDCATGWNSAPPSYWGPTHVAAPPPDLARRVGMEPPPALRRRAGCLAPLGRIRRRLHARRGAACCRRWGIDCWDVLEQLGALVDKSLVIAEGDAIPRYRMLETTRLFALERLIDSGEADTVRAAPSRSLLGCGRSVPRHLLVGDTRRHVARLDVERDNLLLRWHGRHGRTTRSRVCVWSRRCTTTGFCGPRRRLAWRSLAPRWSGQAHRCTVSNDVARWSRQAGCAPWRATTPRRCSTWRKRCPWRESWPTAPLCVLPSRSSLTFVTTATRQTKHCDWRPKRSMLGAPWETASSWAMR